MFVNARFLTQPLTGVQRYGIEISRALKKNGATIRFVAPRNIIHHEIAEELEAETIGHLTGHLWEQIELPLYLKNVGSPLLINLANTAPLKYDNNLVTIHDIAFERFPQTFSWKFRTFYKFLIPRLLQRSKAVVTVSEFSKSEISTVYGANPNKITVVYNSVSSLFSPRRNNNEQKYILAVSSFNFQKNFRSLVKAYIALARNDVKLFLVGSFNKNFADILLVKTIEENSNIILKGRVSDLELVDLYSNALCFVYPSLYEGFGIPPLEAQACGCPVIVSNAASLPEVCGDSVLYCDPYDVDDIRSKINQLLDDLSLRKKLIIKGRKNVDQFSWDKSAKQIYEIARRIM